MRVNVMHLVVLSILITGTLSQVQIPGFEYQQNTRTTLAHSRKNKVANIQECAQKCKEQNRFVCGMFVYRKKGRRCMLYDEVVMAKNTPPTPRLKSAKGFALYTAIAMINSLNDEALTPTIKTILLVVRQFRPKKGGKGNNIISAVIFRRKLNNREKRDRFLLLEDCLLKSTSTGVNYRGTKSVTKSGTPCQRWDSSTPHVPVFRSFNGIFRPANPAEHENFCRNPDFDEKGPWCYTSDPLVRYEYCDVPVCGAPRKIAIVTSRNDPHPESPKECVTCIGSDYTGTRDRTISGKICQKWSRTHPHNHTYLPSKHPEKNLKENYCRNPDGDLRPWCYTVDGSVRWEYCDFPRCNNTDGSPKIPPLSDPTTDCTRASGMEYRGTKSTTVSGRTCMMWRDQYPHTHTRTPGNYPCSGLESNYCRNPGGSYEEGLWCYTTDPTKRWERCQVQDCDAVSRVLPIEPTCGVQAIKPNFDEQGFELTDEGLVKTISRKKRRVQLRIMGGDHSTSGSWPWTASMRYANHHFCGGTIISESVVITAAHCLDDGSLVSRLSVWAGHHYGDEPELQIAPVKAYHLHPEYTTAPISNDLCVVQLERPFQFTDRVQPACLPSAGYIVPAGAKCVATGWGRTMEIQETGLKQLVMPVLSQQECISKLGWVMADNRQMCAGYEGLGHDVCKGDSGGPLACKVGTSWTLQGVTSWGSSCDEGGDIGSYVRISMYLEWIGQYMEIA